MTPRRRASLLVGCGLVPVLLLAVVFRGQLLEPLIVRALHRTLGLTATVDRVGGSVVAGLDIHGVRARHEARTGPVASLEAATVSVRYSLPALLRGSKAFLASLDVSIAGARLDLDLSTRKDAAASPDIVSPAAVQPVHPPRFPTLPQLNIRDSHLTIQGDGYRIEADGLQGTASRSQVAGGQSVRIQARRFSLRHPALREGSVSLGIDASLVPEKLTMTAVTLDGEPLVETGSLAFGERPGELELQAALRLWQGTANLGMSQRESDTEVRWDARGIDLRPDLILVNPALGALRGRLTANGSAKFGTGGLSTLAGELSLQWEGARIAGRALDRLSIEASAEPGTVLVRSAGGHIGPNEVRLQNVSLPSPQLFAGSWRPLLAAASGSFSASLGDVPGFLALFGAGAGSRAAAIPEHRLRLEGRLEKGTFRFARGDLSAGPGKAALEAVTISLPRDDQGWGETTFAGGAAVDIPRLQEVSALFPLPALDGSLRGRISGRGSFARPEGRASLTGRGISVAGRRIGDVDLEASGAAGVIEVDSIQVRQGGNRLAVTGARFPASALASFGREGLLDGMAGSFELRCADIPALIALAGIPKGKIASLPAEHLLTAAGTLDGRSISLASGSFAAAGATLALGRSRISLPGSGKDWKTDAIFEGEAQLKVPDLAPLAGIFGLPQLQGSLKGRATVTGTATDPTGSLEASGSGLAVAGHRVGDVTAKVAARRQALDLEVLEISRGPDRLRARGTYDLGSGTARDVEADVSVADISPWLAEFLPGRIPASGRVHARLRAAGPLPGGPVTFEAEVADGTVQKVRAIRGTVKGQFSLDGSLRRPRVAAAKIEATADGAAGDKTGRVTLDAAYEPGRLQILALEAKGSGGLALRSEGSLPVDLSAGDVLAPGPLSLRIAAGMPHLEDVSVLLPPGYRIAGALGADVTVAGTWKEPQVRLHVSGERLDLAAARPFIPPGPYTLTGAVAWGPTEMRAEQLRLASPAFACSLSGAWASPPPPAALLSRDADWVTGSLDLRAAFSSPDLAWLRTSAEGLRGVRGSIAGEIAVAGAVADPRFSGTAHLADGALRYEDLPPVDALAAKASLAGRTVTLEEVAGNVGGSPFTLSGSVDLAKPADPALDLRLRGTNALLYRAEGLRVRADSDLTLRGTMSALSLAGEIALTDGLFQRSFSVVDLFSGGDRKGKSEKRPATGFTGISFPDPPLRDLHFDVRLTARQPFRIVTTVARSSARPDLRLTGTGLLPILRGLISFDATELVLPAGVMEFEHGSLFFGEKGTGLPELEFLGRMQAQGHEITAQVGGTLDLPEVILSSVPNLPQEELLLFVITGAPPGSASAEAGSMSAMATPLAVYLGKGVFEKIFGGGPSLQNRFEVQVGRELTRSGGVTMDSRLLVKKNLLKQGNSLYITAEQDEYDQDNVGVKMIFKFK